MKTSGILKTLWKRKLEKCINWLPYQNIFWVQVFSTIHGHSSFLTERRNRQQFKMVVDILASICVFGIFCTKQQLKNLVIYFDELVVKLINNSERIISKCVIVS